MWSLLSNNYILNQAEKVKDQRLHIERVWNVKPATNSQGPLKPKFWKTKLKKQQMEEENQEKIEFENKNLLQRIIRAELNPSKYNCDISTPNECPAFNKEVMYGKRMKKELENYKSNIDLYNKVTNINSHYNTKKILKNSELYDKIAKRIQKGVRGLHPCIKFQSPTYFKEWIDKSMQVGIKHNTRKWVNESCEDSDYFYKRKRISSAGMRRSASCGHWRKV